MNEQMLVVSWGGGTNSVAMIIAMHHRDIHPDLILFADTGGEKPHTYQMLDVMNDWLRSKNMAQIVTVKKVDKYGDVLSLEDMLIKTNRLPSVAFGFKTCSQRFKAAPQEKYLNNWPQAKEFWKAGGKITKVIGFDADEPHRAKDFEDKKYQNWYPLIEWDMGRDECIELIRAEGLPQPGKSACFFCPNSSVSEVRALNAQYPDLMDRAIEMESGAEHGPTIKGLGRGNFAWKDVIATTDMFDYPEPEMPCECMT